MIRQNILLYVEQASKESRAFKNFTRGINSKATLCDYTDYLRRFMRFHKMDEDYENVVKLETKEIDDLFLDYLDYLIERGVKGITQRAHMVGIERLFIMNDCIWHKDKIRKSILKDDDVPGGEVPVKTGEVYDMLQCTKSIRSKAFVHYLASTGSRPGGMTDPILCLKHLVELQHKAQKCYGIKIYDGSRSGYWAFLTPEATVVMDRWIEYRKQRGEQITGESPLFITIKKTNTKHAHLTDENARFIMYDLIKASGLKRVKVSKTRYDKAVMGMFRKRFNTILKIENSVNSNIAEKLMAHKKGLDGVYLKPTMEECFTEFVKAIPQLTIDPTKRQELKLKQVQDTNSQLEATNLELQKKTDQLAVMAQAIQEMQANGKVTKEVQESVALIAAKVASTD